MPNPNRGACGFQSNEFETAYARPSKSQLKREMTALQKLGEALIKLSREKINRMPMPDDLREAILLCQQIKDHEGRRRQLQYVGKKMRQLDEAERDIIERTLNSIIHPAKAETARLHSIEHQRDKLLADDQALTTLLTHYPTVNTQELRTLIRQARKEQADNKPPKAYRLLFQFLKQLDPPLS